MAEKPSVGRYLGNKNVCAFDTKSKRNLFS